MAAQVQEAPSASAAKLDQAIVEARAVDKLYDTGEVFELHAAGRTRVIRETRSLDEVDECIAQVERGDVPARIVFRP